MADRNREAVIEKVREIAERVGASEGIEIVDVELLGGGRSRVLRMYIDRPPVAGPGALDGLPSGHIDGGRIGTRDILVSFDGPDGDASDAPHSTTQGVTHADCEFISHQVGTILDVEDVVPGESYTLEVSSPGVERKLSKPREFERFVGQKVKILLRQPVENQKHWVGALKSFSQGTITLEPAPGKSVAFPLEQVEKANLKFEW